jgi:hypothetical protein
MIPELFMLCGQRIFRGSVYRLKFSLNLGKEDKKRFKRDTVLQILVVRHSFVN